MSVNEEPICTHIVSGVSPLRPFLTGMPLAASSLTGMIVANKMYQWIRDTTDITGAVSETYDLTSEDVGHLIRVRMHFTDADDNFHTITSKPVGPVRGGAAFVNAGAFAVNASTSSVVIPLPADVVPGNLLVAWMTANNVRTANALAGWTFINNDTVPDHIVAYRIADGSEGSTVTFAFSDAVGLVGQVLQFSGVDTATPFGVHSTVTGTGTTASHAGITTSSPRSLVLGLPIANSNQEIPVPAGWMPAEGGTNNGTTPYAQGARVVTKFVAPAGSTGPLSITVDSTSWRVSLYEIISRSDCCAS